MTAFQPGAPSAPRIAVDVVDLTRIARHMYALMLRNIASDGYTFRDPYKCEVSQSGEMICKLSQPGCVIAAPSFKGNTPNVKQDYIYHWVRDGAITMIEVGAVARNDSDELEPLVDYVAFSKLCQDNTAPDTFARAAFLVDGELRDWTNQNDGPAIQTLAMLSFFDLLPDESKTVARGIMQKNVDFVAAHHNERTFNLWEEVDGFSFFTRSMQLACLLAIEGNAAGVTAPTNTQAAIADLKFGLADHWNAAGGYYTSVLEPAGIGDRAPYDVNIDIVSAALYGAVPVTDTKLLATAAKLRAQWADPSSRFYYPINGADAARGLGPLLGRYPGDYYDGDDDTVHGRHPWALCTANLAELYYRVANAIARDGKLPLDDLSRPFFEQVKQGLSGASAEAAIAALRDAGDAMLRAVIFHSDHLELSEQFDGTSGFEKSVRNLTWSYAAVLSAVRARTDTNIV